MDETKESGSFVARIVRGGHAEAEREDRVWVESGRNVNGFQEAANEQAGTGEQDEAGGDFGNNQAVVKAVLVPRAGSGTPGFQIEAGARPGGTPGGENAADEAGESGHEQGEKEDRPIDAHLVEAGKVGGNEGNEQLQREERENHASDSGQARQEHRLEKHLLVDLGAAGTKRDANGELRFTNETTSEEEPRNIDAGNQQHGGNGGEEEEQGFAEVTGDGGEKGREGDGGEVAVFGKSSGEGMLDGVEFGVGLRNGNAGAKACYDARAAIAARVVRRGGVTREDGDGVPEVRWVTLEGEGKAGGHHTDDDAGLVAEANEATDSVRVGRIFGNPEIVTDDNRAGIAIFVLARERAAILRKDAKCLEEFGRDMGTVNDARLAVAGREFAAGAIRVSGQGFKGLRAGTPVEEIGIGGIGGRAGLWLGVDRLPRGEFESLDGHQVVRGRKGQRPEQDGVEEAEKGSDGRDADSESEDGKKMKARMRDDLADGDS